MVNNEYFDLIADFADGSLDAAQEDSLFMVLSSNEELRTQFKSHLAVKSAIRSGAGLTVVPAFSKNQIFSKLGISVPSPAIPVNYTFWGNIANFILSNKRSIATGLVSVLATAFVMYLLINPKNNETNSTLDNNQKSINNIAKIDSKSGDNLNNKIEQNIAAGNTKKLKVSVPVITANESEPVEIEPVLSEKSQDNSLNSDKLLTNSTFINNRNNLSINSYNSFAEFNPVYNPGFSFNGNQTGIISIELRNSSNWFSDKATIGPKNSQVLNNFGISGLFNLNQNISLGLDFRQENFFINYRGFEGNQEYNYSQQPNFSTFSGLLRYKADNIAGFKPFGQISLGANTLGFVGRGMIGSEYAVSGNISLVGSIEYNMLFFNYQNNGFRSSKYSINYGFLYTF